MKKQLSFIASLLLLLSMAGCSNRGDAAPELLDPVGVQLDSAVVNPGDIYQLSVYDGEILPHVEQLYFQTDGTLEDINVTLGQTVSKDQLLATLGVEALTKQINTLQEKIDHEEALGAYNDRLAQVQINMQKVELEKMKADGASQTQCRLKELDIEQAQMELTHQQETRQLDAKDDQATLKQLRQQLKMGKLTAPFDGRVVYIGFEKGAEVRGYTTVICLADDSRTMLQTPFVSQQELDGAAKVFAKIGDGEYEVTYIPYDQDEYTAKLIAGETVYSTFRLNDENANVESGMYAALMVYKAYKENVLTVPVNAIYRDGTKRYVYKLAGEQRIRCDITVGMVTDTKAEVTEGLEAGDVVYVKN